LPPSSRSAAMLSFHEEVVAQLHEEGGLAVLGAGLGLHKVLALLLRYHHITNASCSRSLGIISSSSDGGGSNSSSGSSGSLGGYNGRLMFVIGLAEEQRQAVQEELEALNRAVVATPSHSSAPGAAAATPQHHLAAAGAAPAAAAAKIPLMSANVGDALASVGGGQKDAVLSPAVAFDGVEAEAVPSTALHRTALPCVLAEVNSSMPSADRVAAYREGGCFAVTSRILIVDMLSDRVNFNKLKGIVVVNAHRVTDTGAEAFILRLFRDANKHGFIYALSDRPNSLTAGFHKAERILKALFLRRLYLWPRFQ
ncbi:unnamed protein product, partial [Closterium sp. NIES-53]